MLRRCLQVLVGYLVGFCNNIGLAFCKVMKIIIVLISVFIGMLGCATTSSHFHPSDILPRYPIQLESPEKLTPGQVSQDIEYLIYILENGYVGHKFRRSLLEERTIPELRKIVLSREVTNPAELCRQIQTALDQLQDKHISVSLSQSSNLCDAKYNDHRFSR